MYPEIDRNDPSRKRLTARIVDSRTAAATFAGLAGALLFYTLVYVGSYLFAYVFGIIYSETGGDYYSGLRYLDRIAAQSVSGSPNVIVPFWYLLFLMCVQVMSAYVAARLAGWMAPGSEYWSALALLAAVCGASYIFSEPDVSASFWWRTLIAVLSVGAVAAGAHRARQNSY